MTSFRVFVVTAVLSVPILAGCRTEGPSVAISNADVSIPYNTVLILDRSITNWTAWLPWEKQSKIAVDRNVKTTTPTGFMNVEIALRNRTDHMQRLDVQTKFFTADGAQVDESAIETVVLRSQETKAYSCSSLQGSAERYRVEISGAR